MRILGIILPFFALILVVYLGFQPRWHYTLSGDFKNVYFPIAKYFSIHRELASFPDVMTYPPGANLFFLSLPSNSITIYEAALVIANALFFFLIAKISDHRAILGLTILCAGPIILFRFDLLVVLLLILGIVTFRQSNFALSGLFLGLATITKLFPLILLPYFLLVILSRKKYQNASVFLTAFLFAVGFVFFFYAYLTGQDWSKIIQGMSVLASISVHLESVVGSFLTIITGFTNPGPHGVEFVNALWTLSPLYFLGHARIFKFLTPIFLTTIYAIIFFKSYRTKILKISTCLLIILTLLVSSQLFSPQYLLWPAILFSFLTPQELSTTFWKTNLFLILLALVCTQIIYPLNYGELIDFFNLGKNPELFWILTLRNFTLVILAIRLFRYEVSLPFLPKR